MVRDPLPPPGSIDSEDLSFVDGVRQRPRKVTRVQLPPQLLPSTSSFTVGSQEYDSELEDGRGAGCSEAVDVESLSQRQSMMQGNATEGSRSPSPTKRMSEAEGALKELAFPSFFDYLYDELTRGYSLSNDQSRYTEKRRKIYAFLRIPYEIESFFLYGLMQCVDAFTYLFTFLPVRFFMSLIGGLFRLRRWTSAETCDLLKVGIIVLCSLMMQFVDTSMVYHMVRSQAVIKLYLFYNMLEVGDKLFSSLGQDILEALFWTANEPLNAKNAARTLMHFLFAVVYASIHTVVVLLQATTLNVAFNSHNEALLAIMMSNNFVELKGAVFKKFAKANLFQMACSDVRERFHIICLLFIVVLRNMMAVNWTPHHLFIMMPNLLMVGGCEFLVDWLKHAFITKFNEINIEVYRDFTITISFDVIKCRDEAAFSDYSDQVSRRMGFIPIPLSILLIRVVWQTFSFASFPSVLLLFLMWLLLFSIKICNGLLLIGQACVHVSAYRRLQESAELELASRRLLAMKKSKSAPSSPRISLVDFVDVCHQPAGTKGMTVSDWLREWDDIRGEQPLSDTLEKAAELKDLLRVSEERTPRRSHSLAGLLPRPRRDASEPPQPLVMETEESGGGGSAEGVSPLPAAEKAPVVSTETTEDMEKPAGPGLASPKKKLAPAPPPAGECEDLSDVQAYTMLSADRGVERIE